MMASGQQPPDRECSCRTWAARRMLTGQAGPRRKVIGVPLSPRPTSPGMHRQDLGRDRHSAEGHAATTLWHVLLLRAPALRLATQPFSIQQEEPQRLWIWCNEQPETDCFVAPAEAAGTSPAQSGMGGQGIEWSEMLMDPLLLTSVVPKECLWHRRIHGQNEQLHHDGALQCQAQPMMLLTLPARCIILCLQLGQSEEVMSPLHGASLSPNSSSFVHSLAAQPAQDCHPLPAARAPHRSRVPYTCVTPDFR